jgi:hypothetical protein
MQNTMSIVQAPQHGTLNFVPWMGDYEYTPGADFTGSDVFTIQVHLLAPDATPSNIHYWDAQITIHLIPPVDDTTPGSLTASSDATASADGSLTTLAARVEQPAIGSTAVSPPASTVAMQGSSDPGAASATAPTSIGLPQSADVALAGDTSGDDAATDRSGPTLSTGGWLKRL